MIKEAWVEARRRFEERRFDAEIRDGIHDIGLENARLYGKQLEAKKQGFWKSKNRLFKRGGLKDLKKVLAWINRFLDSLSSAIPGVEFLKKIKDMMELVIDDTMDPTGHWV